MSKTYLSCDCGQFQLALEGEPIIAAECHCDSCRRAGERLEALPPYQPILAANGGTQFVLYRKDRVQIFEGQDLLGAFRLEGSTTRRVIATCCNTPVFLEFQGGHWLSLYANLWPDGSAPQPQLRTMTGDRAEGTMLDSTLPSGALPTFGFYGKLLGAWIAMGFKSPRLEIHRDVIA